MQPILVIAFAYPPENVIGAQRPYRLARYLRENGFLAHVLTASENPLEDYALARHVPYQVDLAERVRHRVFFPFNEYFSWVAPAVRAGLEWNREVKFQAIFSTSPPYSVHQAALEIKRQTRLPWVADLRDPLIGNDGRTSWRVRAMDARLEPRLFSSSDRIIANTDATAAMWTKRHGAQGGKIRVIYNGFDPAVQTLKAAALRPGPAKFMLHAGSLYRVSMIRPALDCFAAALKTGILNPSVFALRMIGVIEDYRELQKYPAFTALEQGGVLDCFPDHLPLDQARQEMASAPFHLVIDRYRKGGIIQLPAKVFDCVQTGRPILAFTEPRSPMTYALEKSGVPHVCVFPESDSPSEQAKKIETLLSMRPESVAAKAEYRELFGADHQARRLADCLREVIHPEA